jgi:hypothetical protein
MFIAHTGVDALGNLSWLGDVGTDATSTLVCTAGSIALVILIARGIQTSQFSLSIEVDLRDLQPVYYRSVPSGEVPGRPCGVSSPHVVSPIADAWVPGLLEFDEVPCRDD